MNEQHPLSAELAAKIHALRKLRGVSAQALADRLTEAGLPISRAMVANYESGRKESVSVDFFDAAARALGWDLVTLLTEPVMCPACKGEPPAGFTCNTCGGGA